MLSNNETTAQLIAASLKNILKKKDLDKVRIKEITDEVGLMRPTFYNYFQDKYEVVEYIFRHEVLNPMKPFLESGLYREAFHFWSSRSRRTPASTAARSRGPRRTPSGRF